MIGDLLAERFRRRRRGQPDTAGHPRGAVSEEERSIIDDLRDLSRPYREDSAAPASPRALLGPVLYLKAAAKTAPIPVLPPFAPEPPVRPYLSCGDPLSPATAVRPLGRAVIGDSLRPAAAPGVPAAAPEAPAAAPEPGSSPVLYVGPGWAGQLMSMRVAGGEWDELPAIIEQGLGRNAAAEAAGFRHSRATIADGVRQCCAAIGHPGLAPPLLYRVQEFNTAARAAAAPVAGGAQ